MVHFLLVTFHFKESIPIQNGLIHWCSLILTKPDEALSDQWTFIQFVPWPFNIFPFTTSQFILFDVQLIQISSKRNFYRLQYPHNFGLGFWSTVTVTVSVPVQLFESDFLVKIYAVVNVGLAIGFNTCIAKASCWTPIIYFSDTWIKSYTASLQIVTSEPALGFGNEFTTIVKVSVLTQPLVSVTKTI